MESRPDDDDPDDRHPPPVLAPEQQFPRRVALQRGHDRHPPPVLAPERQFPRRVALQRGQDGVEMTDQVATAGLAQPAGQPSVVRRFLRLVMIEHSVFALPFAYIAALTAMWRDTRSVH